MILISPELARSVWLAESGRLIGTPEGLGWTLALPLSASAVRALRVLAYSSAVTGLLGYWSRVSMAVLTLAGGLCFSLSSREGAVLHDMHLFWLTALLAASRCGDAWSLDAWKEPAPRASLTYGVPTAFARLLLGLVYFFPGLAKLRAGDWASSASVISLMHGKWLQNGRVPWPRIDHVPWLCSLGGALTIAFELSFVFLALGTRRTRLVALAMGLAFHAVTYHFFFISFPSLWLCYVVLIERRAPDAKSESTAGGAGTLPPLLVGSLLALAVFVQGVRGQTDAWPFASYPTFVVPRSEYTSDLVVEAVHDDGTIERRTGREHAVRSQADWGRVYRLSGAYGDAPNEPALRDYARSIFPSVAGIRELRVYRVEVAKAPERWSEVPPSGVQLTRLVTTPETR